MVKSKRVRLPYHKQALGEQIEDPESQGVRVSAGAGLRSSSHRMWAPHVLTALLPACLCLQTKPRGGKRRKTAGGSDDDGGEDEAVSEPPLPLLERQPRSRRRQPF